MQTCAVALFIAKVHFLDPSTRLPSATLASGIESSSRFSQCLCAQLVHLMHAMIEYQPFKISVVLSTALDCLLFSLSRQIQL